MTRRTERDDSSRARHVFVCTPSLGRGCVLDGTEIKAVYFKTRSAI